MFSNARFLRAVGGLAVASVLALAAGTARAQGGASNSSQNSAAGATTRGPRPKADIFFCSTNDVQCRTKINEFGLDEVRDLFIFTAWKHVTGEHTQQLRLLLPDGNLYQVFETKFTTDPGAKKAGVKTAVRSRDDSAISVAFPVAGTHVTQRSLSGTWTVEVYLDGVFIARNTLVFQPRAQS